MSRTDIGIPAMKRTDTSLTRRFSIQKAKAWPNSCHPADNASDENMAVTAANKEGKYWLATQSNP
jgi:hypothetical protein